MPLPSVFLTYVSTTHILHESCNFDSYFLKTADLLIFGTIMFSVSCSSEVAQGILALPYVCLEWEEMGKSAQV